MAEIGQILTEEKEIAEMLVQLSVTKAFEVFDKLEPEERAMAIQGVFARVYADLCKELAENARLKTELEALKSAAQ